MQNSTLDYLNEVYAPLAIASEAAPLLEREFFSQSQGFEHSGIQEAFSWRSVHVSRLLASALIDERGQIDKSALSSAIQLLENHPHSLGPERHHDMESQEHLLGILKQLRDNPEFSYAIKRIGRPMGHLAAERLIRETLLLPELTLLKDFHARRAALAALFTWLRQNVGSCFATAPAIMILQNQPLRFLADIAALLSTGRIVRVINGDAYAVPLSVSWGSGSLFSPIMNRSIEEIAQSPGLQAALGSDLSSRLTIFKDQLETPFSIITAEEIIRRLLLEKYMVTQKEVDLFLERESGGFMGRLIVQSEPMSSNQRAAAAYLKSYELAKVVFKGMTENALLRAWEYSLASLSESKADFASWNLYSSLGLSPEEPSGIGRALQESVQEMLNRANQEIEECQSKYDHLFATAKYLEGRMKRASEREIGWLTADYHIRRQEINRILSERDQAAENGRRLASFFNFTIKFFCDKFKEYFQEVYDAEMHNLTDSPYEDSPAGFRLLYKHGRMNTALWTHIHNEGEFLQALCSFFSSIEVELAQQPEASGLNHQIGQMITAVIRAIKDRDFIKAATKRLVKAYGDAKRVPWAYISGGTIHTLISYYYNLSDTPREVKRWVESPTELLAFYIDTLKGFPISQQRAFRNNPKLSMLAYSPTHAFLIQPALFEEAWDNDVYTYSWIRDTILRPTEAFLDEQLLGKREIEFLLEKLVETLPKGYRVVVKKALENLPLSLYPFEFRESVIKILSYEKWLSPQALQHIADEIDAICFEHLPLFSEFQMEERLQALFREMEELYADNDFDQNKISHLNGRGRFPRNSDLTDRLMDAITKIEVGRYSILSSSDLLNMAKGLLISVMQTTRSSIPWHQRIKHTLSKLGFSYPAPLIVGDSNWVKKKLAFVVCPGSKEIELWCVDNCGSKGRPLSIWKPYLDGTKQQNFGLFTSLSQYGQF